ncbi:hypothetical protein IPH25_02265 [bacterium]|nr:MAG: hypothetical protein IPG37_04405 [bacterium]QQR62248.1 MAG: hypothetical protein IPH25_02265 [bacterium]QQR63188.1 MAG: hypothetical protein IPH67_01805 [bacterium]
MEEARISKNIFLVTNLYEEKILKTWIASDEATENIGAIKQLCLEDSFEKFNGPKPIVNNPYDKRNYGLIFPSLPAIQYAYLMHVKAVAEKNENPIFVHFGEADGQVAFKAQLACGHNGTIIINDLSAIEIENAKKLINERLNLLNKSINNIQFDTGSLFEFIKRRPDLIGKVASCYIQNVEHFMNPEEHQQFVTLVSHLLMPDGYIFATAHTIESELAHNGNPYYEQYQQYKNKNEKYPLFFTIKQKIAQDKKKGLLDLNQSHILEVSRPVNKALCNLEAFRLKDENKTSSENFYRMIEVKTLNCFTPTIYNHAFQGFEAINSFFMNDCGQGFQKYSQSKDIIFASFIGKKKSNN